MLGPADDLSYTVDLRNVPLLLQSLAAWTKVGAKLNGESRMRIERTPSRCIFLA